ncbi:MAG: primosomal protein N' [Polyangiaceae bacterium]|nr:primosomal protein N' [Polyangiaceae bacterium]MCW5792406.1 primosomal protein N' [Polyangiaceae bacterium]
MSGARYARVAVPVPLGQAFSYVVPEALASEVRPGARVLVSFGRRQVLGVVLRLESSVDFDEDKLKQVAAVVDSEPVLPEELLGFLVELARYYIAPIGEVMRLALPAVERSAAQRLQQESLLDGAELRVVGRLVQCARLTAEGLAVASSVASGGAAELKNPQGKSSKLSAKALAVLGALMERAGEDDGWVPLGELTRALPNARDPVKRLERAGLVAVERRSRSADPFAAEGLAEPLEPELPLNAAQLAAVGAVSERINTGNYSGFLLNGVTGSGKTEVYLRLVQRCLAEGRGAIVLVPEIALTPQLVGRFRARLGDCIAVLHSGLTESERHAMWLKLRSGALKVAVGARSALFAPVPKLALIVVDEEHDGSFKQEEGVRYHARDMALLRAYLGGAAVVLGSATPSVSTLHGVREGRLTELLLPERAQRATLPKVQTVDLRRMGKGPSGDPLISLPLHRAIERTLAAGQQVILFLNRRGFAPSLDCSGCGYVAECPHCSVSLTYHVARGERLVCHYCDFHMEVPRACPRCGSSELVHEGAGTERVEALLKESFPEARVARLDRDVAAGLKSDAVLRRVRAREVDILVGTQMVTKGHDLPLVTLVGVLNADSAINLPDYRAGEKAFQLLVQVAGRAGRAEAAGEVLIQTRQPEHPAIACALTHDVKAFTARELRDREELLYPPFSHLALVRVDAVLEGVARSVAQRVARQLTAAGEGLVVTGPSPSVLTRLRGRYRYQVTVRGRSRPALRRALLGVARTVFDRRARVSLDVDPVNML